MADLSVTSASIHPRDWHLNTQRDTHAARSTKLESTALRSDSIRLRDNQDLALRSTESRVNLALKQRIDETKSAIGILEVSLHETETEVTIMNYPV